LRQTGFKAAARDFSMFEQLLAAEVLRRIRAKEGRPFRAVLARERTWLGPIGRAPQDSRFGMIPQHWVDQRSVHTGLIDGGDRLLRRGRTASGVSF